MSEWSLQMILNQVECFYKDKLSIAMYKFWFEYRYVIDRKFEFLVK